MACNIFSWLSSTQTSQQPEEGPSDMQLTRFDKAESNHDIIPLTVVVSTEQSTQPHNLDFGHLIDYPQSSQRGLECQD